MARRSLTVGKVADVAPVDSRARRRRNPDRSFLASYASEARVNAVVALNRGKELRVPCR